MVSAPVAYADGLEDSMRLSGRATTRHPPGDPNGAGVAQQIGWGERCTKPQLRDGCSRRSERKRWLATRGPYTEVLLVQQRMA